MLFPRWEAFNQFVRTFIIVQAIGMGFVILGLIYSIKRIEVVKVILYLQAVIMASSNFNEYNRDDLKNFEGLNMLSTVFSIIFAIFNTYLASMVMEN